MIDRYECLNCGHEGPAREFAVLPGSFIHDGRLCRYDSHICPSCGSAFTEGHDDEELIATPGCPAGAPA